MSQPNSSQEGQSYPENTTPPETHNVIVFDPTTSVLERTSIANLSAATGSVSFAPLKAKLTNTFNTVFPAFFPFQREPLSRIFEASHK